MSSNNITDWSERWSTPLGTIEANAPIELSLWGTSIIGLTIQCPDGKYFGSIRAPSNVYDHVLEFLKRTHGRKLCEVMEANKNVFIPR